ncbi:hypothetical protein CHGG_08922 [Chaetomium globosum CBS 148.51]|uniref:Glycosyl hydrolase family 92 domain-containing protein n=1 Tax=Chaetomium globosum (strain ATCC 6205 / CBS 148.51 / DSM 1962 / NBRC 6347 / NRRL 1970) TaxID=306901 RepID=Q2GSY2_CHAGB|nr:uncharacterized protein CHGG_08922 [Chaetomium globosum CBS 148.51]EAQ84908.1 hypothetical protein CHGG_08922 [Chaetomium globosum CBS 148.51]
MAAPIHLRGMPRMSRILAIALFCTCILYLLSHYDLSLGASPFPSFGSKPKDDILRFVNPLIGTANGGHVFPGATHPYGMAKPVADTLSRAENAAGFVSDSNPILGFSHMHDSGTGGQPSLGNFPLFVHPGCPGDDPSRCAYSVMDRPTDRVEGSVFAAPGYFTVNLTNTVRAEMTATERVALYRFGFLGVGTVDVRRVEGEEVVRGVPYSPVVVVDLVDLMNSRSTGGIQVFPESGRVVGHGTYGPSFGAGKYSAYFCADFRGAAIRKTGTFTTNEAVEEPKFLDSVGSGYHMPTGSAGAWLQFEAPANNSLLARVGVSFMSVDQACDNAEREIPDWHFERVESDARKEWRKKLGAIEIDATGVSEELQTTFWSGLYRTMLSPQNYTGENPLWNSTEPYYDSRNIRTWGPLAGAADSSAGHEARPRGSATKPDAAKYRRRGGNWRNYWNPTQRDVFKDANGDLTQTDFTGFMQARLTNGSFRYTNTRACSPVQDMHSCYYDTGLDTYEGSPWLYSFYAPQDMATLIHVMGGPDAFVERLAYFHTSGISYLGNEQGFLPVFQFHYAGRPGMSSRFVREYIPGQFNATVNGIPGNDDCAMGAFSAFAMMGFFPVAGQDVYLLSTPFFPEVRLKAKQKGKWAVIRVRDYDPEGGRKYIQRARLNGKEYTKNWITHDFFLKGGVLELWAGEEEGSWGTREEDLPPSYPIQWGEGPGLGEGLQE